MQLPRNVREAIEQRVDAVGFASVKLAAAAMSGAYREGAATGSQSAAERVAAYLVTRMPATYAAARAALAQSVPLLGDRAVTSVLDIGAGPGSAALAAREHFPNASVTLVERDGALARTACDWLPDATLVAQDAARAGAFPPHDLVLASYALGEMPPHIAARVAQRMWDATRTALIILEPGTPKGFAFLRQLRVDLLAAGASMLAPCPGAMLCPILEPDWCHFTARVERSSLHRRMKDAALGYEDEKFSCVAFTREPVALPTARIVRRPQHQPGLITLETCTPAGLKSAHATKRDRDAFRAARQAEWGDAWTSEPRP